MWENYKPEILGLLAGFLALNLWYLSSLAVQEGVLPESYDYLINALTVVSAAFFGSYSAYFLNQKKESEKERKKKIASINGALFITLRQSNALLNIIKDFEPWKGSQSKSYAMPASIVSDYPDLKLQTSELDFLLQESDPNVLFDLSVEQERFEAAIKAVNMRNVFHYKELQPALERAQFEKEDATLEELAEAIGGRLAVTAQRSTDNAFSHVYETYRSLADAHNKLHKAAIKMFPGTKFIKFQPDIDV